MIDLQCTGSSLLGSNKQQRACRQSSLPRCSIEWFFYSLVSIKSWRLNASHVLPNIMLPASDLEKNTTMYFWPIKFLVPVPSFKIAPLAIFTIRFRSAHRTSQSKPVSRLHLFFLNMWWSYHLKESDVKKPSGTQSRGTSGYVTTVLYIHTHKSHLVLRMT